MRRFHLAGFIPFLLLLLAAPAMAETESITVTIGGDPVYFEFDQCDTLTVSIVPCEANEWTAHPDCSLDANTTGSFTCNCTNGYILRLIPAANSIGNFTVTMTNYYEYEYTPPSPPSDGGGDWMCHREGTYCAANWWCCRGLECVNRTCINVTKPGLPVEPEIEIICEEGDKIKYTCPDNTLVVACECIDNDWDCVEYPADLCPGLPEEPVPEGEEFPWFLLVYVGGIIGIGALVLWTYRKYRKKGNRFLSEPFIKAERPLKV